MPKANNELHKALIRLAAMNGIVESMALLAAHMSTARQLLLYGETGADAGDDFDNQVWTDEMLRELDGFVHSKMREFM